METFRSLLAWQGLLALWIVGQVLIFAMTRSVWAEVELDAVRTICVCSVVQKGKILAPDFSEFLAGYLDNVKNYTLHNLDEYNLKERFILNREKPEMPAREKAAELGADALLLAKVEDFKDYDRKGKVELRLFDVKSGTEIRKWSAMFEAPYFDPPFYRNTQPYGNLDEVFAEFPVKTYEAPIEIRLLVVSDQRLRGEGRRTKDYLMSQLALASRIMEREFGMKLIVERVKRWRPPEGNITSIAKAAASIPGRENVNLTLVSLGPPAPTTYWSRPTAIGYARLHTNVFVTKIMNAHVFVHEIAHVFGAIHVDQEGCIMQPILARHRMTERIEILPHIMFSETNKRIVNVSKSISIGADYERHLDKISKLASIYEELKEDHLAELASYYSRLLVNLGKIDEALELLQDALKVDPTDSVLRYFLIENLLKAGRYEEAQQLKQADFDLRKARWKLKDYASIRLSTSFLIFGELSAGRHKVRKITVSNLGTKMLEISRITSPAKPFSLSEDLPKTPRVETGESLDIEVIFRPEEVGSYQSTFEIFSNARKKGLTSVSLTGRGI